MISKISRGYIVALENSVRPHVTADTVIPLLRLTSYDMVYLRIWISIVAYKKSDVRPTITRIALR